MEKVLFILIIVLLSACSGQPINVKRITINDTAKQIDYQKNYETCWKGTINNKIPVFLHYHHEDGIIIGEITYLNTKTNRPIKIIGTVDADSNCRLLEFEFDGNITGIITGIFNEKKFTGTWFSPNTRKELKVTLTREDTSLATSHSIVDIKDIYGNYYYQYSKNGYQGNLQIKKVSDNKISFSIFSVTEAPGRNIASVDLDTTKIAGNSYIYKMSEDDSCQFQVKFYNGFAVVNYVKGNCNDLFGWNATLEGIFLKVSK